MLMPLLIAFLGSSAPAPALVSPRPVAPSVQVWLSHRKSFGWGVRARIYAQASADGYLIVFHTDAAGRVHVLFPRTPQDDQFIQGRRTYELDAAADDTAGSGTVTAVVGRAAFAMDRYARNGHWDLEALASDNAHGSIMAVARAMASGESVRSTQPSFASPTQSPPKPDPRQYAERDVQADPEQGLQYSSQPGKIFYPLAYGYSTNGWYGSRGGQFAGVPVGALMSFPYR